MTNKTYIVKTAAALAKDGEGHDLYLYQGAPVPDSVPDEEVARLLEGEFITEFVPEEASDAADEKPAKSWNLDRIDEWAAKQEPPIVFENPDPSKELTKAQKLEQITAELDKRK